MCLCVLVSLPHGAIGWSVIFSSDISWSCMHFFRDKRRYNPGIHLNWQAEIYQINKFSDYTLIESQ